VRGWRGSAFVAAAALSLLSPPVRGDEQTPPPLWEVGVAGIGGYVPDYPASNQSHLHGIPLPYVIYRGQYLQLSPAAVRGVVVNEPWVNFDISATGAFESSHDDRARMGMPGLDYTGQVGPRVNFLIAHDAMYAKIDLELPVRAVFSTDLKSLAYRGFLMAPELAYTHANFMDSGGRFKLGVGPEFATARLMQYYYTVAPQFVTPTRAQFEATGGYLGSRFDISYRLPINDRVTVLAALDPELYSGATNARSPLFKKQYGVSAAAGITFSFYGSEALAPAATDIDAEPFSAPRLVSTESGFEAPASVMTKAPNPIPVQTPTSDVMSTPTPLVRPAPTPAPVATPEPTPTVAVPVPPPVAPGNQPGEVNLSSWTDRLFSDFNSDPQQRRFYIVSDASGDPRGMASRICAEKGLTPLVTNTQRIRGATPADDTITWHFLCRY